MPLRRFHRILSAVLVTSLAIAVSDGVLCLIPCAGMTASTVAGTSDGDPVSGGHCATQNAAQGASESLADPSGACAGDHAIGAWIGERVISRALIDGPPAEAGESMLRPLTSTAAGITRGRLSISPSPPTALIPLRI